MINPLSVATNGLLTPYTIRTLEVSVDGYLIETIVPPNPPSGGGDGELGGGGWQGGRVRNYEETRNEDKERRKKIEQNNQDWMMFMRCYIEHRNLN